MKKYLILVKHSLPQIVENLPAHEWRLSADGQARAQRLAERLSRFQPEIIVSSVELKAMETAGIVANSFGLAYQCLQDIHEHKRNATPFLSKDEFESAVHEFFQKPDALVFGSETANQSHKRFCDAVNNILNSHRDKTIVIIAHGTVISLFVARLIGISGWLLWNELGLPSFVVIDMKSKVLVEKENII